MGTPANVNNAGAINVTGGTDPFLQESKTNESITRDPFQQLLFGLIAGNLQQTNPSVSPTTTAALESFTQNPALAADYFPQLAEPLLAALRPAEDREVTQLTDLFRKAGGTGGGAIQGSAYTSEARKLIGDQAQRRQQVLAQNYVPLTGQLSDNLTNAIKLGLSLPDANTAAIRSIAPLAGSISPLATQIDKVQGGSSSNAAGALAGGSGSNFLNSPFSVPLNSSLNPDGSTRFY